MNALELTWSKKSTPEELHPMLETLAEEYPVTKEGPGLPLTFIKHEKGIKIKKEKNHTLIYYNTITSAARGLGTVLSGIEKTNGEVTENLPFDTFGVMIECSRNAVLTTEYFKKWLRRLALTGCNLAMLYTKDTYELPDEEFFGYLRGRYSISELQEIDAYAAKLGIEMIGCIQALGHLEPVLRWPAYGPIRDTPSVLLTSTEKSYKLIGKMLDFFSKAFKSRRIHLGMDETHDLGRGKYMDLNGYKCGYDIYNEHLGKVSKQCKERGLSFMIWSDMFFRMGSKTQDYYDQACEIPDDVKENIPTDAQLVYWDYYHKDEAFYTEWIRRHKKLGFPPFMASGIWTWKFLWHNHQQTCETVTPCIDACIKENVRELVFTAWGDDGMCCDFDSALTGLCYAAEKSYSGGKTPDEEKIAKRFQAVCGGNYYAHIKASQISSFDENIRSIDFLWDDPILGIYWKNQKHISKDYWANVLKKYSKIEAELMDVPHGNAGDFERILQVIKVLKGKINLKLKLDVAYSSNDLNSLKKIQETIPCLIEEIDKLIASFRKHWNLRYKRFGFEFINVRLGGQKERLNELYLRLGEAVSGMQNSIPELEETAGFIESSSSTYVQLATASYFI
jgi:hexosaminidase